MCRSVVIQMSLPSMTTIIPLLITIMSGTRIQRQLTFNCDNNSENESQKTRGERGGTNKSKHSGMTGASNYGQLKWKKKEWIRSLHSFLGFDHSHWTNVIVFCFGSLKNVNKIRLSKYIGMNIVSGPEKLAWEATLLLKE